jgi:tetratricopeptide (TPR) repeat protein
MQSVPTATGRGQGKVNRPLLVWLVVSVILLAARFHHLQDKKASVRFTVSFEQQNRFKLFDGLGSEVKLNGQEYLAGTPCGLGKKTLSINYPNTEPFFTNLFVWYGGVDLGNIRLLQTRGHLELLLNPKPISVTVKGPGVGKTFSSVARETLELPTGRYEITAEYARLKERREVLIEAHQTNRVVIAAPLTALQLESQPSPASYELESAFGQSFTMKGQTPSTIPDLPAGDYRLRIWRGDYRKDLSLTLKAQETTNTVTVEFDYATMSINSTPADARVTENGRALGTTPVTLSLPSGRHEIVLTKTGYRGTNISIDLSGKTDRTITVSLYNLAYLDAMARARSLASGSEANHDAALAEVEKALEIIPNDPDARALQRGIRFAKHMTDGRRQFSERRYEGAIDHAKAALELRPGDSDATTLRQDAEAALRRIADAKAKERQKHPLTVFDKQMRGMQWEDLFETQKMQVKGLREPTRLRVKQALEMNPAWTIRRNAVVDEDTAVIEAEMSRLAHRQRVVIVIGQVSDEESVIYFKIIELSLGNNISVTLSGIPDSSYKPLQPSQLTGAQARSATERIARGIADLRRRIEDQLK